MDCQKSTELSQGAKLAKYNRQQWARITKLEITISFCKKSLIFTYICESCRFIPLSLFESTLKKIPFRIKICQLILCLHCLTKWNVQWIAIAASSTVHERWSLWKWVSNCYLIPKWGLFFGYTMARTSYIRW